VRLPVTWLDVFTPTPLAGNQLAVVHDADELDDATMLAFARETRLSETTYVQTASAAGADYRNRIWTMAGELPFAGHPSLGTAVAVARARGETNAGYVQQTPAGLQPVDVQLDGGTARASMLQEPPAFGPTVPAADVLAVAGLGAADIAAAGEPQVVSTGVAHLIVTVRDRAVLTAAAAPAAPRLRALLEPLGAIVLYLAAADGADAYARGFFLGPDGVIEDPATGSAAGPLLAYLREHGGADDLTVHQGLEIGRPSRIDCAWQDDRPRVSGDVVVVADGHLRLPD
jgi:trans-2,3-dihydro-3-hydroxyanthranilate isomerase